MNYKETFYFVGRCLNLEEEIIPEMKGLINSGKIDWDKVVWVASNHLVFPAFYTKLYQFELLPYLPTDLITFLQDIFRLNKERNIQIIQQLKEINTLLRNSGICPVFIKGTACLLDGLYSEPGERMIGDIDLLVEENNFLKSIEILKDFGYSSLAPFLEGELSLYKHYPRLVKDSEIAALEVHRHPVALQYVKYLSSESVISSKKKAVNNEFVYVPSDNHKILLNYIHGQLNDKAEIYGSLFLRNFYDLHLLLKRNNKIKLDIPNGLLKRFESYLFMKTAIFDETKVEIYNFHSRLYLKRFNLNLSYPVWARINNISIYFFYRLTNYIRVIFKSFYRKEFRHYIFSRMKDLNWYHMHLLSYKNGLKRII